MLKFRHIITQRLAFIHTVTTLQGLHIRRCLLFKFRPASVVTNNTIETTILHLDLALRYLFNLSKLVVWYIFLSIRSPTCQVFQSLERNVHELRFSPKAFRFLFKTSFNLRRGQPTGLVPSFSTLLKMVWGRRSLGTLLTWPAHRSLMNLSLEDRGSHWVRWTSSSLVIPSSQNILMMGWRDLLWKALILTL